MVRIHTTKKCKHEDDLEKHGGRDCCVGRLIRTDQEQNDGKRRRNQTGDAEDNSDPTAGSLHAG
jgi:hypothetical protein